VKDDKAPRLNDEDRAQLRKLNVTEKQIECLNMLLPFIATIISNSPRKEDVRDELKKVHGAVLAARHHVGRLMAAAGLDWIEKLSKDACRGNKLAKLGLRRISNAARSEAAIRVYTSFAATEDDVFGPTIKELTLRAKILRTERRRLEPKLQRRPNTASPLPVALIDEVITAAGQTRRTVTALTDTVMICYRAVGHDGSPERTVKTYRQKLREREHRKQHSEEPLQRCRRKGESGTPSTSETRDSRGLKKLACRPLHAL
jgi:hypothetical protein